MPSALSKTTLVSTGGQSNSLRPTVPLWIVDQFGLESGDKLVWKVKLDGNSMYIGVFPPSKEVKSRDE